MDLETLATNIIKLYPKFGHKWNKQSIKIKYQKGVLFWFRNSANTFCASCVLPKPEPNLGSIRDKR